MAYAAANRNALSNADILHSSILPAQYIYIGYTWNGSAWVSGGTNYIGKMTYFGTVQAPDYDHSPATTVGQIYANAQTLSCTHILWTCWDEFTGTPATFVPTYLTPFINANPVPSTTYPSNYPT